MILLRIGEEQLQGKQFVWGLLACQIGINFINEPAWVLALPGSLDLAVTWGVGLVSVQIGVAWTPSEACNRGSL